MEWKTFGKRARLGAARNEVLKIFRMIHSSGSEDSTVCPSLAEDRATRKTFNVQAYLISKQRMHEIETEKAMVLSALRHERWKAGGPT